MACGSQLMIFPISCFQFRVNQKSKYAAKTNPIHLQLPHFLLLCVNKFLGHIGSLFLSYNFLFFLCLVALPNTHDGDWFTCPSSHCIDRQICSHLGSSYSYTAFLETLLRYTLHCPLLWCDDTYWNPVFST